MTEQPLTIGLIGCGKMGQAMLSGWLASDTIAHVIILDPMAELPLQEKTTLTDNAHSFAQHTGALDMLVIAVKPQIINVVCDELKDHVSSHLPVLSIAAGKTIDSFKDIFGSGQPVLRAMPNTPAAIGKGMTVLCASSQVTKEHREYAQTLLNCLGQTEWIGSEELMDAVTAVSGSGPAYLFHLIETLALSGEKAGLLAETAMKLARQTVIGAAALCEHEKETKAAKLRENVTSPGGTTEAALEKLMDGRLQEIYDEAVFAARNRGKDLSA